MTDAPSPKLCPGCDKPATVYETCDRYPECGPRRAPSEPPPPPEDAEAGDLETFLDPGIRRHVTILRANGIETFESCQGGDGHSFPEPTVRFHGNSYEGHRAFAVAMTHGLPVLSIRHVYDVNEGILEGPRWEIVFRTSDERVKSDD